MSQTIDHSVLASLYCYGFRGPSIQYVGNSYLVNALLDDLHSGVQWYTERHLTASVHVRRSIVEVKGAFRHKLCDRLSGSIEPFPNLTCSKCALIPLQNDFRMQVRRESSAVLKKGECSTAGGIQVGYLGMLEVSKHTRMLCKKFKL